MAMVEGDEGIKCVPPTDYNAQECSVLKLLSHTPEARGIVISNNSYCSDFSYGIEFRTRSTFLFSFNPISEMRTGIIKVLTPRAELDLTCSSESRFYR